VLEIDASAGFEAPAKVSAQQILRGEWVYAWTLHLSGVAPEDVDRRQKAFWREALPWAEPSATTWSHDERRGVVVLTMTGEGKPGWETDTDGHSFLDVFASGFFAPRELRRPAEQDQSAPWSTDFPAYRCWVTTIRLPPPAEGWGYRSPPINLELGGTLYRRDARLENGVMRTVKSKRTFLPTGTQRPPAALRQVCLAGLPGPGGPLQRDGFGTPDQARGRGRRGRLDRSGDALHEPRRAPARRGIPASGAASAPG
jgi:hypothetical protein